MCVVRCELGEVHIPIDEFGPSASSLRQKFGVSHDACKTLTRAQSPGEMVVFSAECELGCSRLTSFLMTKENIQ